jgi:predicted  nucleic acid-binding Zn ribbon protein
MLQTDCHRDRPSPVLVDINNLGFPVNVQSVILMSILQYIKYAATLSNVFTFLFFFNISRIVVPAYKVHRSTVVEEFTYLLIYGAEPFLRSCQLCSPSGEEFTNIFWKLQLRRFLQLHKLPLNFYENWQICSNVVIATHTHTDRNTNARTDTQGAYTSLRA